ncbi:MAG: DUF721 domain-containing protein [Bacteriovoracaceae bacterium]|nr:DUF721 domain-containing protein [Bacteriovoracaceae bacterium]
MFKTLSSLIQNFDVPAGGRTKNYSKKNKYEESFDFLKLIKAWPEIVGNKLAEHTVPLKNTYKTLTILANHPAFATELSFMEEILKKKIFEHFPGLRPNISRIKFQTGNRFFENKKKLMEKSSGNHQNKRKNTTLHPYSPQFRLLKEEACEIFKDVTDNELKETLTSIFIQNRSKNQ